MNKKEKNILQKLVEHKEGILSPADFVNGVAQRDRRAVDNLIARGYVEEVPQDMNGGIGTYSINFYRATEKGIMQFAPWHEKGWYNFKEQTPLWVGIFSIVLGILTITISSIVAFGVPYYESVSRQHDEIEVIYKNLITNEDILISNSNNSRYLSTATSVSQLPESYFYNEINGDSGKVLQEKFGLIQYRFFVYYLQQINLLNKEIEEMRGALVVGGATSTTFINARKSYLATSGDLDREGLDTKFSHIRDTECLTYFFERSFSYLDIDPRGKIEKCSSESYNRIYQFGFLERATPRWMLPGFKQALNEMKPGFGDQIIDISEGY